MKTRPFEQNQRKINGQIPLSKETFNGETASSAPSQSSSNQRFVLKETQDSDKLVSYKDFEDRVGEIKKDLQRDLDSARKDYISIFGIFAAIITFLGIEAQAFNKIDSFSKLAGFSSLLISMILLLLFAVERISKQNQDLVSKNLLLQLSGLTFAAALTFFWYHVSGQVLFWEIIK